MVDSRLRRRAVAVCHAADPYGNDKRAASPFLPLFFLRIAERTHRTTIDTAATNHLRHTESSARPVLVFARCPGQFPPCAVRDGRCSTLTASAPTTAVQPRFGKALAVNRYASTRRRHCGSAFPKQEEFCVIASPVA